MPILALRNPTFQPAMRVIASITQANPAVVTTAANHGFSDGQYVELFDVGGMDEVNGQTFHLGKYDTYADAEECGILILPSSIALGSDCSVIVSSFPERINC